MSTTVDMTALFANLSGAEIEIVNNSFQQWLHYIRHNESCILDLMPKNFQSIKFYYIIGYFILLLIGAVENIGALCDLLSIRRRNVASTWLLIHLTLANMIVIFVIIPIEIAWRVTLSWPTGELGCRLLQFVRALGPYLSSCILVGISLDRYLVLTKPLYRGRRWKRGIVIVAWVVAIILSSPQSIIYHLEQHQVCALFIQCVSLYYFESEKGLKIYTLGSLAFLYLIPLIIIIYCYAFIIITIIRHTEELARFNIDSQQQPSTMNSSAEAEARSNDTGLMHLAVQLNHTQRHTQQMRLRDKRYRATVKKTLAIIIAFIICWTPWVYLMFLNQVYPDKSQTINPYIKDALLMFGVSNACLNPLVYGTHTSLFTKIFRKLKNLTSQRTSDENL